MFTEGRILATGTYDELMQTDESFAKVIAEASRGHGGSTGGSTAKLDEMDDEDVKQQIDDDIKDYVESSHPMVDHSEHDSYRQIQRRLSSVSEMARRSLRRSLSSPSSRRSSSRSSNERSTSRPADSAVDDNKLIQTESIRAFDLFNVSLHQNAFRG